MLYIINSFNTIFRLNSVNFKIFDLGVFLGKNTKTIIRMIPGVFL